MFLAKIWFFLVALVAAVALTIALVLPRPAQRTLVQEEQQRLVVACGVIDILLGDDARNRVELAGAFARTQEIVTALEAASGANSLDEARMKQVRDVGEAVMKTIQGSRKPDFAMLIDRRGRVVARVHLDENDFGDIAAGRPIIDDALAGYLRDDLWTQNGTMYFVSAAPVIKRDPPVSYVGAIVLGHQVTNALASKLAFPLNVDVGFHLGKDDVAGSKSLSLDHAPLLDAVKKLSGGDLGQDCQANKPLQISNGKDDYTAIVARLPGEAAAKGAFYSVFIQRPAAVGFMGTLKSITQSDLGFGSFPWPIVGGGFLIILGLGIALMMVESDRPLKRLAADAVRLAKGEKERRVDRAQREHPHRQARPRGEGREEGSRSAARARAGGQPRHDRSARDRLAARASGRPRARSGPAAVRLPVPRSRPGSRPGSTTDAAPGASRHASAAAAAVGAASAGLVPDTAADVRSGDAAVGRELDVPR